MSLGSCEARLGSVTAMHGLAQSPQSVHPWSPAPGGLPLVLLPSKVMLSLSVASGRLEGVSGGLGGAVRLTEGFGGAPLVTMAGADWLARWAQDGPGAGPFKDLGTKSGRCLLPRQVQAQLGSVLLGSEPTSWGMGWAVFPWCLRFSPGTAET